MTIKRTELNLRIVSRSLAKNFPLPLMLLLNCSV